MIKFIKEKLRSRAVGIAFLVLLFFTVIGQFILEGVKVSLDAFQISGGVILFLFGLTMIFGDGKPKQEKNRITDYEHVTIFRTAKPHSTKNDGYIFKNYTTGIKHHPKQDYTFKLIFLFLHLREYTIDHKSRHLKYTY